MAKNAVTDWDTTAANNTDIAGINIQGSGNVSQGDDAIRTMMSQIAAWLVNGTVTFSSTDAGALVGPELVLYRNSASPAASDLIGNLRFDGEDSAGNTQEYARIIAQIADATSGSEDGTLQLQIFEAGTRVQRLQLDAAGVKVIGPQLLLPNGTVSLPSLSFSSDTNTGFYWDVDGSIVFSGNGVRSATLSDTSIIAGTATAAFSLTSGTQDGAYLQGTGINNASANNNPPWSLRRRSSDGTIANFYRDTTNVGSISVTTTATAYNTSSDHRRKRLRDIVHGFWDRLMAVRPIRFMWDTGQWDRGFLAHEFAEQYPNSVTGEKDAVDEDGNPIWQEMQPSTPEVMADVMAALQDIQRRLTAKGI